MADEIIVNGNLQECSNNAEEFRKDSCGDMLPYCEEITVMKTEVKEECYDFEMPVDDIEFVNVNEEYIPLPENNLKKDNLGHSKSTEQSLNENFDIESCEFSKANIQENKYRCDLCHSEFDKEIYLRSHYKQCTAAKKDTCLKDNNIDITYCHAENRPFKCTYKNCKCTPEQQESCNCDMCEYVAANKTGLKKHVLKHTTESKEHRCNECKYVTYKKSDLTRHFRTHTNEKPYKCSSKEHRCSECKYVTYKKSDLTRHFRTHTNEKPFKCTYKNCKCAPEQKECCDCETCEYTSTTKANLNQHMLVKHSVEPKRYKCKDCKYAAHTRASLVLHHRTHTGYRPFKCTYKDCICPAEQKESCQCDKCGYAAINSRRLKHHVLAAHNLESKKYNCSDCKYATHTKEGLRIHMRTHTDYRPYKCTYKNCKCTPGQDEPCKCDTCGYAAAAKYVLQRHILCIHTNNKPFKCTYKNCKCIPEQKELCECNTCGYATIQRSRLNRHVLVRHSATPKKA